MSTKNLMKNLILLSVILGLVCPLSGCADKSTELSFDVTQTSTEQEEQAYTDEAIVSDGNVVVYVCGAVYKPGVYELESGSRLYAAIELAGGMKDEADKTYLNMARELIDGEQITVYTSEEVALLKEQEAELAIIEAEAKLGLVNINTADITELTTLSGIGESRARAIIDYREKNGAFSTIEDIKNVEGIKDGLFSKIKDKITI